MDILIISPGLRDYELKKTKKLFGFYRSTLPLLASLIPSKHSISLVDESIDGKVDVAQHKPDIVIISPITPFAPRAYELSSYFREKGAVTLIGGMHASALPDESLEYCSAVGVGEAENVLPGMIKAIEEENLEHRVYNGTLPDISKEYPELRWDIARKSAINWIKTVDISRGCPFTCDFCSVSKFQGNKFRFRSVDSIVSEVEESDERYFFLNSDNIVGNPEFAKELFSRLKEYDIKWVSQASVNLAKNKYLLKLMQDSGCMALCVGFESISQDSLKQTGKNVNRVREYIEAVERIHEYGINLQGSFIFGFDNDTKGIGEKTLNFVLKSKLDLAFPHILTPYPGTRLYHNLQESNKLIKTSYPSDWQYYDTAHVVFEPANMKVEELYDEYFLFLKETFSMHSIYNRMRVEQRVFTNLLQYLIVNLFHGYKNRKILNSLHE